MDFAREAQQWRRLLLEDILPWWLRHAVDAQHGGLCTCIGDDGVIQAHDKYVWSQVRGLWTFAAAYRRVSHDARHLQLAHDLFDFCMKHGRNGEGDWLFRLSRDGTEVLDGPQSIQTDAYAICALVEYARAGGPREAIDAAMQTHDRTWRKLCTPGSYQTRPYPIPPGTRAQRVSMQFSLAYWDLAKLTGDAVVEAHARQLSDDVLDHFRRPELQTSLEYLGEDNRVLPPPMGTYISPGHGIETAWFQIENLRHTGDARRLAMACEVMRWSFEKGWDEQYGGLYLGADLQGGEPYLPNSDTKIWWPHCEAICGSLLAHEACGEPWCLAWYERVRDYALAKFPDREHGEWTQRLDRHGRKIDKVVALPVKDPFHLPRALVYAIEALERLATRGR